MKHSVLKKITSTVVQQCYWTSAGRQQVMVVDYLFLFIRVLQNCVDFSLGQCVLNAVFGGCQEDPVTHKMLT
jgi:hypothetical protein